MSESTTEPVPLESAPFAALVAACGEMPNPPKNKTVSVPGKYKFEYADLASIMATVRPVLARHGLCLLQPVKFEGGMIHVATLLIHATGKVVAESVLSCRDPLQPQAQGSQITYLRRYSVCSLLGIVADDDDDGNTAQGQDARISDRAPKAAPAQAPKAPADPFDVFEANCRAARFSLEQVDAWLAAQGKKRIGDLDTTKFAEFTAWLFGPSAKAAEARAQIGAQ